MVVIIMKDFDVLATPGKACRGLTDVFVPFLLIIIWIPGRVCRGAVVVCVFTATVSGDIRTIAAFSS